MPRPMLLEWTLLRHDLDRWLERAQVWIAWHVPTWLVKWATIRAFANATTGKYGGRHPDEVRYRDVCEANGWN